MNKTDIEWADMTWNPVTGCLHRCEYCYARNQTRRFEGYDPDVSSVDKIRQYDGLYDLTHYPMYRETKKGRLVAAPYPFGFMPTFHRYRLDEPAKIKKPQNIFVCSMADLFGDWVPDEWIEAVFRACEAAPQHRYLFLTKNPKRYCDLANFGKLPKNENFWYGTTLTQKRGLRFPGDWNHYNTFLSIEPILEYLDLGLGSFGGDKWIIVGAETGNRKGKVIPERHWIENIVETAGITQAAVFMKNSLAPIWGKELIQEGPW